MKKYKTVWEHEYLMKANNMFCGFNMPEALKSQGEGEDESYQGLPPYAKRKSFLMDKYPACPKNWLESAGTLSSYFVPVQEGQGMWLDFNKNNENTHEVAIVVSVQGVNPLTGIACEDQYLEQYIEQCPKCKTDFKPERLCESCGFKYPKQNYICTTGTPHGLLWLDGFRAINGAVRQYLLTAEKMKGVASNIIGNDRVFAIGISFFLSKDKKLQQYSAPVNTYFSSSSSGSSSSSSASSSGYNYGKIYGGSGYLPTQDSLGLDSDNISVSLGGMGGGAPGASDGGDLKMSYGGTKGGGGTKLGGSKKRRNRNAGGQARKSTRSVVQVKQLEVSAGANIKQLVYDDTEQLDFWRDTPEATLCINYCLEEDATTIIEAGEVSLEGDREGFLQNVPVGN